MNKLLRQRRGLKLQGTIRFQTESGDMTFKQAPKPQGARRRFAPVWFRGGTNFCNLSCAKGD